MTDETLRKMLGEMSHVWERLDNEWVDTGLASREAYELCKYGEILQV